MADEEFWIAGRPATFATRGEAPWRAALAAAVPPPSAGAARGMRFEFVLESLMRNGQPFDLDNLCDPVFSVVINGMGWCGGRRPNMFWWHATRAVGRPTGLRLTMESHPGPAAWPERSEPVLDAIYAGPLPRSATDPAVPHWLEGLGLTAPLHSDRRFSVRLQFGGPRVNIGEVSTGTVKSLLDCLYPVLGGRAGAPEDWRVDCLHVEKAVGSVPDGQVRMVVRQT